AGADGDATERVRGDMNGHLGLTGNQLVQPSEERTPTRQGDPSVERIACKLGWGCLKCRPHRLDNRVDGLGHGGPHFLARHHGAAWQSGNEIAALDRVLQLPVEWD